MLTHSLMPLNLAELSLCIVAVNFCNVRYNSKISMGFFSPYYAAGRRFDFSGLGSFHPDKNFHLKEEFTTSLWRVEKSSIPALTGLSLDKIKFYLNPI